MHLTLLVAGTNEPSNCNALADAFIQGVQLHHQATVDKIRLKNLHIDHFTIDCYAPQCNQEEDFCRVQESIQKSQGLVIATPIWNFGVPAHFKNLIDRMGSFALDETRSKGTLRGLPFFCIFTGGAPYPAWKGMMQSTSSHVPQALQYFGASYIGHHYEGKCVKGRGQFGLVVDGRPESFEALRRKGSEFAKVVAEFERTGIAPITHRAKGKIMRWGEALLKKVS